jgi:hypothetical protein
MIWSIPEFDGLEVMRARFVRDKETAALATSSARPTRFIGLRAATVTF